ncbi:AAA-like domain-containing protein [Okeanomitos corallinicola TIOX110]|uniref:AAA-like domain-containing protein n=1 Tax=Okeanomitos corallinicola TIOX110 TaxID=3133117 RepID=A0ABZ2USI7_9CYAN
MDLNVDQAIKIANEAVLKKCYRGLTDVEIIVIKGAWKREEYDTIAANNQYAKSYLSQDIAPKLWKLLTKALGEKVKKSNFKAALKRYWEKQCWDKQFTDEDLLPTSAPITINNFRDNSKVKETTSSLYLTQAKDKLPIPELYVERFALEFLCSEKLLQPGSLIWLKAPKLMGKTSLMERVLAKLKQQGYRTVSLSLQMVDTQTHLIDLNKFLRWFCFNLSRELKLPNQLDKYWDEEGMGAKVSCTTYLLEYLLAAAETPLVLYLDDIEVLFPYPQIYKDFFTLLRSWYEKTRNRPNWKKLRLAIAYSPDIYIHTNLNQSLFNIGLPIELPELTKEEVQRFSQQYGFVGDSFLVDSLMQLVGGHPYLLELAFSHLKNYPNITLNKLLAEASTDAGIYRHYLRELWLRLQQEPELLTALQTVINSPQPVRLETMSAYQLKNMGLVKLVGNEVETSCQLYRSYFGDVIRNQVNVNNG